MTTDDELLALVAELDALVEEMERALDDTPDPKPGVSA